MVTVTFAILLTIHLAGLDAMMNGRGLVLRLLVGSVSSARWRPAGRIGLRPELLTVLGGEIAVPGRA
jgi:hypothetical protein